MNKIVFDEQAPLLTLELSINKKTALICFNEEEIKVENVVKYQYDYARIEYPYNRDTIIAGIIKSRYNDDKREAIINNNLEEHPTEEHIQEMRDLQEWRATAKEVAKRVLELL